MSSPRASTSACRSTPARGCIDASGARRALVLLRDDDGTGDRQAAPDRDLVRRGAGGRHDLHPLGWSGAQRLGAQPRRESELHRRDRRRALLGLRPRHRRARRRTRSRAIFVFEKYRRADDLEQWRDEALPIAIDLEPREPTAVEDDGKRAAGRGTHSPRRSPRRGRRPDRSAGSASRSRIASRPTRSSSRARCMPEALVRAGAEREVVLRRAARAATRSASSQRDSSWFDEPVSTPTGEPAGIGQPATSVSVTATRLTIVTDVSHRSVSSITSGSSAAVGVHAPPARRDATGARTGSCP